MSSVAAVRSDTYPDRVVESLRAAVLEQLDRTLSTSDGHGEISVIPSSDRLRVGIDLVSVADVATSVRSLGCRYLYRVFTPHERACARMGTASPALEAADMVSEGVSTMYSIQSLAARFAAKEAAVKVLCPRGARPEWRSIEVHRTDGGWCELRLSGLAALLAAEAGIETLAVSVTHEPTMAAACVVAMSRDESRQRASSTVAP